ncbi:hypothetical protein CWB41_04940 [Methylovirgula ligni]|nr:hypothetical protein CWB41_04940 [Methylovirgula ligni]
MLRQLRDSSAQLAIAHPDKAVSFLKELEDQGRKLPVVLAAGIGDGLSHSPFCSKSAFEPIEVGRLPLLQLVAYSKRFSSSLAKAIRDCSQRWTQAAVNAFEAPDADLIRRARRNLLPTFDAAEHAPLLPPLLTELKDGELAAAVRTIGRVTSFQVEEFDLPLTAAARGDDALRDLREAILDQPPGAGADRFLLGTLRLEAKDVAWLLSNMPPGRGRSILGQIVDRADDGSLQSFRRDERSVSMALDTLLAEPAGHAPQIARLLLSGRLDALTFVTSALQVYPHLSYPEKGRIAADLLRRSLGELPANSTIDVSLILADTASEVDSSDLALLLTQPRATVNRIAANIAAVSSSSISIRRKVASRVDRLTNQLISRGTHGFSESTYSQWASLIEESRADSPEAYLRASIEILSYALRHPRRPLSSLIVVSFAPVYRQLLASKGGSDFGLIPSLLLLPLTFFTDWDRAKTARKELVETFMSSDWPPSNLMLAALNAGIDQKVLRLLSRTRGGNSYVAEIWDDANRLDEQLKQLVRNAITSFSEHPNVEDLD